MSRASAEKSKRRWRKGRVGFQSNFYFHFIRKGENFSKPERQSETSKTIVIYLRLLLPWFVLKFSVCVCACVFSFTPRHKHINKYTLTNRLNVLQLEADGGGGG